jgi:16S rRNA (uracil1498-N3)-methyltransferase
MLKRLLSEYLPQPHFPVPLSETEAQHALRVLRLGDGDRVEVMDGNGHQCVAILRTREGPPRLEYLNPKEYSLPTRQGMTPLPIILEMAVLKGDAMEWVVEKAVELGVKRLAPILTQYTVVQMKSKGPEAFQERWQKVADQALKQCGRLDRLEILLPQTLENLLSHTVSDRSFMRVWCDEKAQSESPYLLDWFRSQTPLPKVLRILIGPEGGWSDYERTLLSQHSKTSTQNQRMDLGPLILRAETAAVFAMSVATAHFRISS